MGKYEKVEVDGKTLWVPMQQEALPLPPKPQTRPTQPYPVKRVGRRLGERKTWY